MVQSLGISIGNLNSYVAAGLGGGIEILLNEYSTRSTPSMVAFTDRSRSIGVDASSNFFMNLKNTIYDIMVLIGRPYKDLSLEDHRGNPKYSFKLEEAADGQASVVVKHLGEERKFTITQVLAMLFTKLRGVASNARDCVLSCPQFFNDNQRAALHHAALIAGLNPLDIISDMSAVALNYAYYRTTEEDTHKFIAFINFGQSNLQSVVAWLNPREDVVRILAAESESIGGKDFDKLLADYFVQEHKLDLNLKSYLKLVSSCEKLKKLLSANANQTPIHVESLISEEKDFTGSIDRATFESLSTNLLQLVESCLKRTLETAKSNYLEAIQVPTPNNSTDPTPNDSTVPTSNDSTAPTPDDSAVPAPNDSTVPTLDDSTVPTLDDSTVPTTNDSTVPAPNDSEAPTSKDSKAPTTNDSIVPPNFDLQVVEILGGSTRVPAIKQLIQNVFKITPSTTLNTDEAVARGCALHCATLHPGMKVKRKIKVLNSEYKPGSSSCDKELFRVELELIASDRKYLSTIEARNTLEEYIYSERARLQEGDQFLNELNQLLDWLMSDKGEEATEEEYKNKLSELKKASEARLLEKSNNE